jgi:hypothetical protein
VTVAARVPPDLAEAVARLADAGDRSISREIGRAIQEHVANQDPAVFPPLSGREPERRGLVGPAAARGEDG